MNISTRNNIKVIGTQGTPIIYAHGFGCNKEMWNAITPAFTNDYQQILFDFVGSGQSDLSAFDPKRYDSVDGYAEDIIEVCEHLGITEDAIFVGHSISCSAGILASLKKPKLFKKMVLVGPSPCFINHPPDYKGGFEKDDLEELLQLMEQNYLGWADYLSGVVSGSDKDANVTQTLNSSFCSTDPETAKIFARTTFFCDDREAYKKVSNPCLVLHHKFDSLVPEEVGLFIKEHIPNNTFVELEVKGHCAHLSHPDLVIKEMNDCLRSA